MAADSTIQEEAFAIFRGMVALDLSRESMDARVYEAEIAAKYVQDQARKTHLFAVLGAVRRLMNTDTKLATAGILAGRNQRPYSQL